MTTLTAKNLTYSYSKKNAPAISKVSVEIKPGTLTALVGPNGAGKSTLLRLMQGQSIPDKGEITIDGKNVLKARNNVALMPQRSSMNWKFPITVEKLVSLGKIKSSKAKNYSAFQIKELISNPKSWMNKCCEIEAAMQRVGISSLAKRRLDSLSGGQQQRALLAKTLMSTSKIFLLDEPCSALDPPSRDEFLKIIRQIADAGMSVFISSHDWGSSLNAYDKVVVLDKTIMAIGTPNEIQNKLDDICCLREKSLCNCD